MQVDIDGEAGGAYSVVEPPFVPKSNEDQFRSIRDLMTTMGRKPKGVVIYTSLPACNSDSWS